MKMFDEFVVCFKPADPSGEYQKFYEFLDSAYMWNTTFGDIHQIQTHEPIGVSELAMLIQRTIPDQSQFYVAAVRDQLAPCMA